MDVRPVLSGRSSRRAQQETGDAFFTFYMEGDGRGFFSARYIEMKNTDIQRLYFVLSEQSKNTESVVNTRKLGFFERNRQSTSELNRPRFISILQNHLFENTQSVVFSMNTDGEWCFLTFFCPITIEQYDRLEMERYVPLIRSKISLILSWGECDGIYYACSSVKLPLYHRAEDLFHALDALGREMEKFL